MTLAPRPCPRRKRRHLETLPNGRVLQVPHPPNLHHSRRPSGCHPIRPRKSCGRISRRISISTRATPRSWARPAGRTSMSCMRPRKLEMRRCRLYGGLLSIRVRRLDDVYPHITSSRIVYDAGQKCSALSRLYVSASVWNGGFKNQLLLEIAKIKVGSPLEWSNYMGPVMYASRPSSM